MRTKTLLLTAALSAAGVATSMAQVYSQNAVGYINLNMKTGFNLVANQLNGASSTITALLGISPQTPAETSVYKLVGSGYQVSTLDPFDNVWLKDGLPSTDTFGPGEGVWIACPSDFTITFVGEVPQGTLNTTLPSGFSIRSSQVPQAGDLTTMGLGVTPAGVADVGDYLYKFNGITKQYTTYNVDTFDSVWYSEGAPLNPTVSVGDAFFYFRAAAGSVNWTRTFSVN